MDDYNEGLALTRPIHIDYAQAVPATYYIDPRSCMHLQHGTCQICVQVCGSRAIDFTQQPVERSLEVGAVILSPGFGKISEQTLQKFGYGRYPDVMTSIEFERMLNASGPFRGEMRTFTDKSHPRSIAFLQCVGSRDIGCDNGYCSSVCCMYAIKEAMVAKEHDPDLDVTIYYMDIRTQGKEFDRAYSRAENMGIQFVRARVADVVQWEKGLRLTYSTMDGVHHFAPHDLLVLSVGLEAPADAEKLSKIVGIELNRYDFCQTDAGNPLQTTKDGVFVAGAFQGPKDIPESVTQASGVAAAVSGVLTGQRGLDLVHKEYPGEKKMDEDVRIGVFVCHCGINIGSVVDVPGVTDYAGEMKDVVYYTDSMYSCSQDAQEMLKEKILEHSLNRVVIAACSPRTHEPLFQETLRDAGLNRCLIEMVNIRDQCSWVHAKEPDAATRKSKDLVRMAVAKARKIKPLPEQTVPVNKHALVIGGGVAGMTSALAIAEQGFSTTLIEREKSLGGRFGDPVHINKLIAAVKKNKTIEVLTETTLVQTAGFVGNYASVLAKKGQEETIDHGVVVLATGGKEHRPEKVLDNPITYSKKVVTQSELATRLAGRDRNRAPASVVMVQCAGSRGDDLGYCSKVCCVEAVKNALTIKEINPASQVVVLYRDIRTYGTSEDLYKKAREQGVVFVPYSLDTKPVLAEKGKKLEIIFYDPIMREQVIMQPDLLVLSVGIVPDSTEELSKILKLPLTEHKFFLESHVKLRPVELAVDGVFFAGLVHNPKPMDEIIAQAQAAAAKASIPLVKGEVAVDPIVSNVDQEKCIGCGLCVNLCPYKAIEMVQVDKKRKARTIVASCKACGICASHCPTLAISMGGFTNEQIDAQIIAFGEAGEAA